MKVIKFSYELPVSTENEPVIAIVAKELGYDGVIGTPEEYIEKHFNNFFTDLRAKVESGLKRHYGEAGIETINIILSLYDTQVIKSITIENENTN